MRSPGGEEKIVTCVLSRVTQWSYTYNCIITFLFQNSSKYVNSIRVLQYVEWIEYLLQQCIPGHDEGVDVEVAFDAPVQDALQLLGDESSLHALHLFCKGDRKPLVANLGIAMRKQTCHYFHGATLSEISIECTSKSRQTFTSDVIKYIVNSNIMTYLLINNILLWLLLSSLFTFLINIFYMSVDK